MKFYKYEKVDPHTVATEIKKIINEKTFASEYEKLVEYFSYGSRTVINWSPPKKSKPLMRLTLPFLLVYVILMILGAMIKWVITGTSYFNHEGFILRIHRKWLRILNF